MQEIAVLSVAYGLRTCPVILDDMWLPMGTEPLSQMCGVPTRDKTPVPTQGLESGSASS